MRRVKTTIGVKAIGVHERVKILRGQHRLGVVEELVEITSGRKYYKLHEQPLA